MAADLLLRNARVRSGTNFARADFTSIAIQDGVLAAVGPQAETSVTPEATVIDVDGAFVAPGLVDTHTHLGWAGEAFWSVNWADDVTDHATALGRVRVA